LARLRATVALPLSLLLFLLSELVRKSRHPLKKNHTVLSALKAFQRRRHPDLPSKMPQPRSLLLPTMRVRRLPLGFATLQWPEIKGSCKQQ
jgi:hypothetical protein